MRKLVIRLVLWFFRLVCNGHTVAILCTKEKGEMDAKERILSKYLEQRVETLLHA